MAARKRASAAPVLVDTSAWIEWLVDSEIGRKLGKFMPDKPHCIVPTIVQLELYKWLLRETDEERADQVIAYTQKCRVLSLDTEIALLAAEFHHMHKLATADAIVYASARHAGATLLTCDAHFSGLDGVHHFDKSAA
ncbi:MAG: type II toxin-antitoxin system VapC family toxin [Pseudoxanthomonas sp.]